MFFWQWPNQLWWLFILLYSPPSPPSGFEDMPWKLFMYLRRSKDKWTLCWWKLPRVKIRGEVEGRGCVCVCVCALRDRLRCKTERPLIAISCHEPGDDGERHGSCCCLSRVTSKDAPCLKSLFRLSEWQRAAAGTYALFCNRVLVHFILCVDAKAYRRTN